MKRVVLGLLLASIAGVAAAADMSARPAYTKAPMMSPAINWTGFYVGAMGGYASEATSDSSGLKGGFAGGTLGYNWQSGMLVLGIEADGAWADVSQTVTAPGLVTLRDKVEFLGTVRGRVGAAFNQVMLYGTGGFAFADNKLSGNVLVYPSATARFIPAGPLAPASSGCSRSAGPSRRSTSIAGSKARPTSPPSFPQA
jgi:outer membrane immunogenic protein